MLSFFFDMIFVFTLASDSILGSLTAEGLGGFSEFADRVQQLLLQHYANISAHLIADLGWIILRIDL